MQRAGRNRGGAESSRRVFVQVQAGLGLCLAIALGACGGKSQSTDPDAGPDVVVDWHEPDYPYRVLVTLNPHPDRDRTDVPVFAELAHPGAFLLPDVRVYAEDGDGDYAPTAGSGWSQPDGSVCEVGFTAEGSTPAGAERRFLVYYRVDAAPAPWTWDDGGWATSERVDLDADGVDDGFVLTGGGYGLGREINPSDGTLRRGRRSDGDTFLDLTAPLSSGGDWRVAEGFATGYQLEDAAVTHGPMYAESEPHSALMWQADAGSAAVSATWDDRADPVVHDLFLTYRVFSAFPFVELTFSASFDDPADDHRFSSADYNGRTVYLTDAFDRMVSDTRGDEPLLSTWDTSMRWLVLYDSATDRGVGWFSFGTGVLRGDVDGAATRLFDSYGHTAGGRTVWRQLWMAAESATEIADLFDAMKPGVTVGAPENRDLNILRPESGEFYFPEDGLEVVVTTPGGTQSVTARLLLPDGSELPVALDNDAHPLTHRSVSPLVLDTSHPEGSWTLLAEGETGSEQVVFEYRHPTHPHLLFDAADLPALQARKDDPAYASIWNGMLSAADNYGDPLTEVGEGLDIRGYADRLINLALIQLMDPAQPYDDLLWTYFFTMLRYPNWSDAELPFNNLDLTVGQFLTALALTYDWHYDRLTPAERRELREHLKRVVEPWRLTYWMRTYRDITPNRYGTVTNNHYWINHEGVAAAAFVLAGEMDEVQRSAWVDHVEEDLAVLLGVLEPDGTSHEGVAYHTYGQIHLFPWVQMRDRALGGNTADSVAWFGASVLWDLYSVLPGGDDNYGGAANFGDCPPRHYQPPRTIAAWLSGRLSDPQQGGIARWVAEHLDRPQQTAYSYLWYDPTLPTTPPTTLPTWRLFPDKGIFTWRSSWQDDATYFSLKSGSYWGGHEQPDAGHFILHRAGVPYLTDHGYSYLKVADEHNLVTVDDLGQHGQGDQWMDAVDPAHWAEVIFHLADDAYFDVIADPSPMSLSETLSSWQREVVGLGPDIVLVRDTLAATALATFDWLLHSYRSDPPTALSNTYTYYDRRLEDPWTEVSVGRWQVLPQDSAPVLHVADLSATSWAAAIEPSVYVPELDPDTGSYNHSFDSFQVGTRLRRTASDTAATSLVALYFGDTVSAESLSDTTVEGVRLHTTGGDVAVALWPTAGAVSGVQGFDLTGALGGRRYDLPLYFGRAVTHLADGATVLVSAAAAVDLVARLEHGFGSGDPGVVVVSASAATDVSLFCPQSPTEVRLDGAVVTPSYVGQTLTLSVPVGTHRFELH